MTIQNWCGALLVGAVLAAGCGQAEKPAGKAEPAPAGAKHDHSDWWCAEHGIPEKECSLCDEEVAKAARAKGDWCDKHNRAKSQCFVCDPSLKEKYAARYRARYGKEPPPVSDEKDEGREQDRKK